MAPRLLRSVVAMVAVVAITITTTSCSPDGEGSPAPDVGGTTAPDDTSSAVTPTGGGDGGDGFSTAASERPDTSGLPSLGDGDPSTVTGTLANGLTYYLRDNDNPGGSVSMRLAIDAGSAVQAPDQVGVAHFLEHMLFNGTEEFPENELTAVLRSFGAAFGADVNAYTSRDETVYELTMPDDDEVVDTGLDVLAQWLTAAAIDPEQVVAERGVVLDEFRQREESADGRVYAALDRLLLAGSSYEDTRPIGTIDAIAAMTSDPLRRFYDTWYRPDNAAVVVVGDIDVDAVESGIVERFEPVSARSDVVAPHELSVSPNQTPVADVVADADLTSGLAVVAFPLANDRVGTLEQQIQREILDQLAFDIIATRLSDDASSGAAPFRSASASSASLVRPMDAPAISLELSGAAVEASVTAVIDEFERIRRFGPAAAEVARAVDTVRSANRATLDGAGSRQDAAFADGYLEEFFVGRAVATAERQFDFVEAVLDRATPETITWVLVDRWERAGAHVFVALPEAEAVDAPSESQLVAIAEQTRQRPLDRRDDAASTLEQLMAPPDAVQEIDRTELAGDAGFANFEPVVLEFGNGVRVVINESAVVEGYVEFGARSPGGLAALDDDDVADAVVAGAIVYESGVADIGPVAFDAFVADREIDVFASVNAFTEELSGFAATKDVETLFQYLHLLMTDPRVDTLALENHLADAVPLAQRPASDPEYASWVALLDARYDDVRFLELTPEQLATVTVADVERVMLDRFGDASDWVFSFSGDIDVDQLEDLARRYLGTLPATGRVENTDFVEPPPPPGKVSRTVRAGTGQQASVTTLWTASATADRRDDTVGLIMAELLSNRLIETLREQLGETYSPSAVFWITDGGSPNAELMVTVSTSPDRVEEVARLVMQEIDDLRTTGPSADEFDDAQAVVVERLGFISNPQINDEVLRVLVDPAGNADITDYLDEYFVAASIDRDEVAAAFVRWAPPWQYIQVVTLPT